MANEPSDDDLFQSMIAPSVVSGVARGSLKRIRKERKELHDTFNRYNDYLNLLLPSDPLRRMAYKFTKFLEEQLTVLSQEEIIIIQESRKSSNRAAMRYHKATPHN